MTPCDEIRVFDGRAEPTGNTIVFRSAKNYPACSSMRDLARKYRIYGDGLFYLERGHWPASADSLLIAHVLSGTFQTALKRTRELRRR